MQVAITYELQGQSQSKKTNKEIFLFLLSRRTLNANYALAGEDEEDEEEIREKVTLKEAYRQLYAVIKLPAMRKFTLVLIACRLGMLPAEQVVMPAESTYV